MNVRTLVPYSRRVPFEAAFAMAKKKKKALISNAEADKLLVETKLWKPVEDAFPIWTGTMAAYTGPGESFASEIAFRDHASKMTWVLKVPSTYQGMRDSILLVDHPHYELEKKDRTIHVIPEISKLRAVGRFPSSNGVYGFDEKTRVPIDVVKAASDGNAARFLYRVNHMVGPIVRSYDNENRGIFFRRSPSDRLGALSISRGVSDYYTMVLELSKTLGIPYASFENKILRAETDQNLECIVTEAYAREHCIFPLFVDEGVLAVAVAVEDIQSDAAVKQLNTKLRKLKERSSNLDIQPFLAKESQIMIAIERFYGSVPKQPSAVEDTSLQRPKTSIMQLDTASESKLKSIRTQVGLAYSELQELKCTVKECNIGNLEKLVDTLQDLFEDLIE